MHKPQKDQTGRSAAYEKDTVWLSTDETLAIMHADVQTGNWWVGGMTRISRERFGGPVKLVDCEVHGPGSGAELFVVEGDSAAASVSGVRDSRYQAVVPMQGKPLNAMKASRAKVVGHPLFAALTTAVGTGIEPHFDLASLRYDRILVLMAGAACVLRATAGSVGGGDTCAGDSRHTPLPRAGSHRRRGDPRHVRRARHPEDRACHDGGRRGNARDARCVRPQVRR